MSLIAARPESKPFELPAEGAGQAVISEVEDLGLQDQTYNGVTTKVYKIALWWQFAELDSEKKPKRIREKYTKSLHEKARLYARVKGLFGKEPPLTLDLGVLVGTNRNVTVVHTEGKGKDNQPRTYANIVATLKLNQGQAKLEIVPRPKKDEVKAAVAAAVNAVQSSAITDAAPIVDDDIPF